MTFFASLYERRRPLLVTAAALGGGYLLSRYTVSRLEDMKEEVIQSRAARDNLRKRFAKNQEDCAFTVLAMLPELGTRILEDMDVERLTGRVAGPDARAESEPTAAEGARRVRIRGRLERDAELGRPVPQSQSVHSLPSSLAVERPATHRRPDELEHLERHRLAHVLRAVVLAE